MNQALVEAFMEVVKSHAPSLTPARIERLLEAVSSDRGGFCTRVQQAVGARDRRGCPFDNKDRVVCEPANRAERAAAVTLVFGQQELFKEDMPCRKPRLSSPATGT